MTSDNKKDDSDFASMMKDARRLDCDRVGPYRERQGKPLARHAKAGAFPDESSDTDWQREPGNSETWFDTGIQRKLQRRIRQGLIPVDDSLDLHGCSRESARQMLSRFFQQVRHDGARFVIVVHGKGNRSSESAVLKPMVHRWLSGQDFVLAWCPAQPAHGGSGASYVYLR